MKIDDTGFGGIKAILEDVERSHLSDFLLYWSQRPFHFKDLFGFEYTDTSAKKAWKEFKLAL